MKKVVGFDLDMISIKENHSDKELYKMAVENDNAVIIDNPKDFFTMLNNEEIDTENKYWFMVTI